MRCPYCYPTHKLVRLSDANIFRCPHTGLYFRSNRGSPSPSVGMIEPPIIEPSPTKASEGGFDRFLRDLGISRSDYNSLPPSAKKQLTQEFLGGFTDSFKAFLTEHGINPEMWKDLTDQVKSHLKAAYYSRQPRQT